MATVSSLGLSGLPLTDLLNNLQKNENQVLAVISDRKAVAQARLTAYGKLKDAIASFQKSAETVGKADTFGAIAAKSSSEAISVSSTNKAIAGQYSIQVSQLATSQTLVFAGQADRTSAIGTDGTLSITLQDGTTKSLDLTGQDTSLNGLANAINNDKDIGVNATVINDGSGTPYRLLLTSRETGAQNAVSNISVANNATLDSFLQYAGTDAANVTQGQAAQDALLNINGVDITSATNTVENVIDGVTLTLNQTTTTAATVSLSKDDSVAKKAIQDFVSSYNSLLGTLKSLTSYDVDSQRSSALTGDSVARSVQTRMRDAILGGFDASQGTNLSQIGITTDPKTGELQIDDTKLSAALADNTSGVTSLFTSDTGIGKRVSDTADTFTKTGGMLSSAQDGLTKTVADIQEQYEATADRIEQRMSTYRTQFTQLDAMVSQMNSLSSYLTQQLSALGTAKK
ncbi:flagellar filament capping protein FliD [Castellaniella sp.]|uniref:flagellar filament capping protein FliD n=1 Tax=Castellaniella sp. TaxID=1955812 RepID=UPI003A95B126